MKRALLLLGIGLLAGCNRSTAEPQYEGKSLSYWQAQLKDEDSAVRVKAAFVLREMGAEASDATPDLLESLGDGEQMVRMFSEEALGKMGPEIIPALMDRLDSKDKNIRMAAAAVIGHIAFREWHPSGDPYKADGRLGPQVKATIPRLRVMLRDEDREVRLSAALTLRDMGAEVKVGVPDLLEAMGDSDATVRIVSASALALVGPEIIPAVTDRLRSKEKHIRAAAVSVFGWMAQIERFGGGPNAEERDVGPEIRATLPRLIDMLRDGEGEVRAAAADALGRFRADGKIALPALTELVRDKDPTARRNAAQALEEVGWAIRVRAEK